MIQMIVIWPLVECRLQVFVCIMKERHAGMPPDISTRMRDTSTRCDLWTHMCGLAIPAKVPQNNPVDVVVMDGRRRQQQTCAKICQTAPYGMFDLQHTAVFAIAVRLRYTWSECGVAQQKQQREGKCFRGRIG